MRKTIKKETKEKERLIPLTSRHLESSYVAISELAEEFKVGKAVVVRMSTAGQLAKYLGNIRFIDEEQGQTINENIVHLGNVVSDIRNELSRIGLQFSDEIKRKKLITQIREENEEYKKSERRADWRRIVEHVERIDTLEKEMITLEKMTNDLKKEEFELLMKRYEEASKKMCEILTQFLV